MSERVCLDLKWIELDKRHYIVVEIEGVNSYKDEHGKIRKVPNSHKVHYGFKMDSALKKALDSMCHNIHKDMDFVILISGSGDVRVGKSVLAMQVMAYISSKLGKKYSTDNICYTAESLMKVSEKHNKTVFVYDEAREGLNTGMAMANIQKKLLQFFAECGQLNNVFILVLPCFFELTKRLAINRGDILLDCTFGRRETKDKDGCPVTEKTRGTFRIFKSNHKKMLYLKGKDDLNYHAWRPATRPGTFNNVYVLNEWEYRSKKRDALRQTKEVSRDRKKERMDKKNALIKRLIKRIAKDDKGTEKVVCDQIGVNYGTYRHWEGEPARKEVVNPPIGGVSMPKQEEGT